MHEEGGFADAGLAGEKRDRAEENAAAKNGIEVGKAGLQAFFFVRNFKVVNRGVFQEFAGGLTARNSRFFIARVFGDLFDEGVPGAAFATAAVPTGVDGTALLADELRMRFSHRFIIALR